MPSKEFTQWQDGRAATLNGECIERLHSDHHRERESHDDHRGETGVQYSQSVGPPTSEFEPASQKRPRQTQGDPVEGRV
jgi:hypothetical protein